MKQKRLLGIGSLLALLLAFVMVACGPAVPRKKPGTPPASPPVKDFCSG
ncbi:MAG: hypothetical protein M5U34_21945 [Chloroflexi bacterium]|nr:hypothetical protein [Chloroflexota bacterium]